MSNIQSYYNTSSDHYHNFYMMLTSITSAEYNLSHQYRMVAKFHLRNQEIMLYEKFLLDMADESHEHYLEMLNWCSLTWNGEESYLPQMFNGANGWILSPRSDAHEYLVQIMKSEEDVLRMYKTLAKLCPEEMQDFVDSMITEEYKHILEIRRMTRSAFV